MAVVDFRNVDIIFGDSPTRALDLLDRGESRESILAKTGNVVGVADANLAIEGGETCVLMGLSGSGKSTLLRAVNGLNRVTRGEIHVQHGDRSIDVTRCGASTLRELRMSRISMVFQQFGLLPWRTVRENVGFGLELRGTPRTERESIVAQKLELVGLEQWGEKYAHELSGGMQQRVGLARAFATDADILLMDEPFSALDPLIRTHLQEELIELQRRLRKTIIFVSHDLDEALRLGNHIAIMESGRIVQYGEPEQIVLNPANEYVADFVANMNPLHVLRGTSLMTPVAGMKRSGDELLLDATGRCRVRLDAEGRLAAVRVEGGTARLVQVGSSGDIETIRGEDVVAAAPADITMKTAIEIRHATGRPVPLLQEGRLVGVVGDAEIYRGMLRQSQVSAGAARDAAEAVR